MSRSTGRRSNNGRLTASGLREGLNGVVVTSATRGLHSRSSRAAWLRSPPHGIGGTV
ncbi:hypothetical protein [Nocardia gamkensis]|uniref:Uncharacterized protein n=1 Tax=Nocardia gamkensis TaxID=352869 RepID=A0A7X6LAJ4_9NOCA|nr:hypothetical protein [Nocardia gamkensis]NKY30512.1 hypothetical protein [Nocardia gamkensis]